MTPELVIQLARRSFEAALLLSAPLLLFSLVGWTTDQHISGCNINK